MIGAIGWQQCFGDVCTNKVHSHTELARDNHQLGAMAARTEYSPLAQDIDPPGVSDVLTDPDAPPIYYGDGHFSPPSSLSDDEFADQEKPLDPGAVERGSFDDDGDYRSNVMRDSGGLFLGRKVSNVMVSCLQYIYFVLASVATSLFDHFFRFIGSFGSTARRLGGTDVQPDLISVSSSWKQTHYHGSCFQRNFRGAEAQSGLGQRR